MNMADSQITYRRNSNRVFGRLLIAGVSIVVLLLSVFIFTVRAQGVSLELIKRSSDTVVESGEVFEFIFNYRCASFEENCVNAILTDQLPPEIEFVSILDNPDIDFNASTIPAPGSIGAQVIIVFDSIDDSSDLGLAAGDTGIAVMNVRFPPGTIPGTIAVNNASLKAGEYIKLDVTDNGKGIPAHQLDKVFDPYFSTKETFSQKGMGLGLAICYAIIKKHNGHISLKSEVGKGTTVELILPAYRT